MIFKILLILILTTTNAVAKDISEAMNEFFDDMGFTTNVTKENRYKGQSAGYYTGGSVYARSKVINTPVANIQLPRIEAGCGGIDIFGGSFSFINEDQFVAIAKAVASNALGYGFNMGLKAICPTCQQALHELQEKIDKINQFNINSCEIAKAGVSSIAHKLGYEKESACKTMSNSKGIVPDYSGSSKNCNTSAKANNVTKNANAEDKASGSGPRNLTWDILTREGIGDQEYKELLMSLVGTFVDDGEGKIEYVPAIILDDKQISAFIGEESGSIKIYKCTDVDNCLKVDKSKVATIHTTFLKKVKKLISGIMDKISAEKSGDKVVLTASEKAFIQNAPLPIYKIINVNLAYQKASGIFSLDEIEDYLAVGMLLDFLDRVVSEVELQGRSNMSLNKLQRDIFDKDMEKLRKALDKKSFEVHQKFRYYNQIVSRIDLIEAKLKKDLSTGVQGKRGL